MNEVKTPKKPLIYYYGIVMLVLMLFNFLAMPWLAQRQIREVDYGTFMQMTENQEIGRVEVQENQILFTNKEDTQVYKTGLMNDPDLIYRLKDSGAVFAGEIVELGPADCDFCRAGTIDVKKDDGEGGRPQLHDVRYGKIQRQGICEVLRGDQILRRGRGG